MKKIRKIALLLIIISILLTGCNTSKYPSWYHDSIFRPKNSMVGLPGATYRISEYSIKIGDDLIVEMIYDDQIIDKLIKQQATLQVIMINYEIIGEQQPKEVKSQIITSIGMEDDGCEYLPLQRKISILDWTPSTSGTVSWRMHFVGENVGDFILYEHLYYVKQGDTIRFFKACDEFYEYQKNMGEI